MPPLSIDLARHREPMKCAQCSNHFDQITTRQLFCDSKCRNAYNAKQRTRKVQIWDTVAFEFYIYEIRCKINDWRYVGLTADINKRWGSHLTDLNTKRHPNIRLQDDFILYGVDNFEISILLKDKIDSEDVYWKAVRIAEQLEKEYVEKCIYSYNENGISRTFSDGHPERIRIEELKIKYRGKGSAKSGMPLGTKSKERKS